MVFPPPVVMKSHPVVRKTTLCHYEKRSAQCVPLLLPITSAGCKISILTVRHINADCSLPSGFYQTTATIDMWMVTCHSPIRVYLCGVLADIVRGPGPVCNRFPLPAPGAGCRVPGAGCRAPGAGCRAPGAGCRVPGAGCQGAGCRVPGPGCQGAGCQGS